MSFASLGLSDALLRAVADAGYSQPTPIQLQAIPAVLAGGDLLAGAQTGTGKTAGFVLPILQRLSTTPRAPGRAAIRVLIMTPTRELASQVEESVRTYGKHLKFTSTTVFGGVGIQPQVTALRRGVDILVATPGRLLDHHRSRTVDLSGVEVLVLDEADRMLDMGFIPDIKRILAILPKKRQNLLFSATFSDEIRDLAGGLLHSPVQIQATPRNSTVEAVKQTVHPVDSKRKAELLIHLIKEQQWFQVLVFTRTKHGANRLAGQLEKGGITALAIHGNKSQGARTRALSEFKSAKLQTLVATDIAARGLDIELLPHVVNFDIPHVPEDYVHRIGRTGRAGATGEAISLVSAEEMSNLRDIERLIKRSIPRVVVPGFEAGSRSRIEPDTDAQPARPPRPARSAPPSRPRAAAPRAHAERPRSPANAGQRPAGRNGGNAARPAGAARPASKPWSERPTRPGGAPASRSNPGRGRAEAVDPLVRAHLPPGFRMAPGARRGRGVA